MKQLEWKRYEKGEFAIDVARAGNDVYGNPLYRVKLREDSTSWERVYFGLTRRKRLYRYYESKGYGVMQSYNIDWDAEAFLDEMVEHDERAKRVGAKKDGE